MIVANWKCNGSRAMLDEWVRSYLNEKDIQLDNSCLVLIAPPSVFFNELSDKISKNNINIFLCSQDIAGMTRKHTGAISSELLIEMNVDKFCIVGHSERRLFYKEDNQIIKDKVMECFQNKINPILCVGETEGENSLANTKKIIEKQLSIFENESISEGTTIAYEPVWAIGTGKTPNPKDVNEIHKFIKDVVQSSSLNSLNPKVLYGGSVSEKNAKQFFSEEFVDGALIGGASLDGASFAKIVNIKNGMK